MVNVNKIIENKIKEHEVELQGSTIECEKLRKELKETTKPDVMVANKLLIMKDKILFHKSCVMVLKDLQAEIAKETYDLP